MTGFIVRRLILLVPMLLLISLFSFIIIQIPPGDYLTTYISNLESSGVDVDEAAITRLEEQYGLNEPMYVQYAMWIKNIILHGQFGRSFQHNRAVEDILKERLPTTLTIAVFTMFFIWIIAVPIAIYSAINQYSLFDYIFTFLGFIGLALPNFLFALVLMWIVYTQTGLAITGLFSPEFVQKPWSMAKLLDLFKHVWLPLVVVGTASTAGLIRVLRATLLDELGKQYVVTARAKGLPERKLLFKYPIRVAINPVISTIGWMLPRVIGGTMITAIVLNLKTIGPTLYSAIVSQDMYLAGSIIMLTGSLIVFGTFISDLLLAWLDPRIRYENKK